MSAPASSGQKPTRGTGRMAAVKEMGQLLRMLFEVERGVCQNGNRSHPSRRKYRAQVFALPARMGIGGPRPFHPRARAGIDRFRERRCRKGIVSVDFRGSDSSRGSDGWTDWVLQGSKTGLA